MDTYLTTTSLKSLALDCLEVILQSHQFGPAMELALALMHFFWSFIYTSDQLVTFFDPLLHYYGADLGEKKWKI